MENHHFQWENPLQITIFNSYVSLPEGTSISVSVPYIYMYASVSEHIWTNSNLPTWLRTRIILNRAPIVHGSVYQLHDFLDT